MAAYLIRRALVLVVSLAVASLVIFAVVEVIPGDPATSMLGINARPDTLAALRDQLGLNQPAPLRYLSWVGGMLHGDFGISYAYRSPIGPMIAARATVSLPLAAYALALALLVGIPAGALAAARQGRATDWAVIGGTQLGIAVPNFWVAMLLVLLFAVRLHWVAAGGFPGWSAGPGPALAALTLPAVALALPQAAILARVTRSALIEVMDQDFIRTARARGLSRGQALRRHAFRNAMIPVATIVGLQISFLIAGAIIIEQVFYLPGLGRLVFQAIGQRDLILVESVVMLLVFAVILVTFVTDLAYALIDPRLRRR